MTVEEKSSSGAHVEGKCPSATEKIKSALSEYLHVRDGAGNVGPVEFVNRLKTVVDHVKSLQEIKSLYKLNNKMETEATNDLKELEFLVREMRAVMANISRLRSNRVDISKEINSTKGSIEKRSKEEVQEMETVIAIYDKDLLKKWHVAKKTSAPTSLENFIANLAGKKQAIEHVYKLALDRLAALKKNLTETPAPPKFHLRFSGPNIIATPSNNDTDSDTDTDEQFSLC